MLEQGYYSPICSQQQHVRVPNSRCRSKKEKGGDFEGRERERERERENTEHATRSLSIEVGEEEIATVQLMLHIACRTLLLSDVGVIVNE